MTDTRSRTHPPKSDSYHGFAEQQDVDILDEVVAGDSEEPSIFSRAEAEEVWRLAAKLQADAAQRLEGRSRTIAGGDEGERIVETRDFSLTEVKDIASEAGLVAEFVELALREREARALMTHIPTNRQEDLAVRVLGTTEERITVSRVIGANREKVLDAMQHIFPGKPYGLELIEVVGDDTSLADATLVFKVPQLDATGMSGMEGSTSNMSFMYNMTIADLNRMTVTLHALDEQRTEVTIQLDTGYGRVRNMKWSIGLAILLTVTTAVIAGAALGANGAGWILAVLGTVFLAGLVGAGSVAGYGFVYRNGLGKGKKEMDELLRQVDVHVRTDGAFGRGSGGE